MGGAAWPFEKCCFAHVQRKCGLTYGGAATTRAAGRAFRH
jgi:hypothetical protein